MELIIHTHSELKVYIQRTAGYQHKWWSKGKALLKK